MSKASQRKDTIVSAGRQHALRGGVREDNPYRARGARGMWYRGFCEGEIQKRVQERENLRKRRSKNSRFWRAWYRLGDMFVHGAAQTPARRRGLDKRT